MRIRMNDSRERLYEELMECSPENTKSKAIDDAVRLYCMMAGHNMVNPQQGILEETMSAAIEHGSLTPRQLAELLTTDELPVEYETDWSVGQTE